MNLISDAELERICERKTCDCNCMRCEAFAANMKFNEINAR